MERFAPDTWRDALLRPVAMAAPDGGVYVEIMAPDLRFASLELLTIAVVVLALVLRRKLLSRPIGLLLAFTWLAFIPWLATSGNGRYFIPVLLLAGPLCIALIASLPFTKGLRLTLAVLLVAAQAFVVFENDPRMSWRLAPWGDKYFSMELTHEDRTVPAAYVLISSISHSLVAPLFDPRSRWIGVSRLPEGMQSANGREAQRRLQQVRAEGLPLKLLVPTLPDRTTEQLQPDSVIREEINRLLAPHRMALEATTRCEMRRSETMAARVFENVSAHPAAVVRKIGFWICPLAYPVDTMKAPATTAPAAPPQLQARAERVFAVLERLCPRSFAAAQGVTVRLDDAMVRKYDDMKAYVADDGRVWFLYWRALNANYVGTSEEVLAPGFKMECNHINGRSGLPWERGL